jgi:microsomal epoxide hydrolase
MENQFGLLPASINRKPEPFTLNVSDEDLSEFRDLLKLSKIGPTTWWNRHSDHRFGVSHEWLTQAKETWLSSFDWRKHEENINRFPNFKIGIEDSDAGQIEIHFAALFSKNPNAVPVLFLHGYPGSFVEFLPMMQLLADKYTPETIPYHIVVPSLPDYGLSGSASKDVEMTLSRAARIMNQLMTELGFGTGYVAQGGDLGSMLVRILSVDYEACKAFHGSYSIMVNAVLEGKANEA